MISLIAGKILSGALAKALKGGDAWKEKGWGGQQAVVDHAKKLGYPGKIAPAGSDKKTWTSFTKALNAWKASGMPGKKTSKPAAPETTSSKKKKPKTKPAPAPADTTPTATSDPGLGPYPERNVFFPMLAQEYTAPSAMDLSAYLPADAYGGGMLTGGAPARYDQAVFPGKYDDAGSLVMTKDVGKPDYSDVRGLLYQPFTTEYQQAFVPENLWNYQPVQFDITPVQYTANPYAKSASKLAAEAKALEAAEMASMYGGGYYGDSGRYGNGPTYVTQALKGGGKSEGDLGYGASLPAYGYATVADFVDDMVDRISGGPGATGGDMAGWGGKSSGASVGGSGGSSGVGPGGVGGGVGKGY